MKVCIAWQKNMLKEMTKGLWVPEKRINRKHQVLSTHITSNMKLMLILVLKRVQITQHEMFGSSNPEFIYIRCDQKGARSCFSFCRGQKRFPN